MIDTNRLPDPEKIDQFLRDRASVHKLQKAIQRAWDLLDIPAQSKVYGDFDSLRPGLPLNIFLKKHSTQAAAPTADEKRLYKGLLIALIKHGPADLAMHPGFVGSTRA